MKLLIHIHKGLTCFFLKVVFGHPKAAIVVSLLIYTGFIFSLADVLHVAANYVILLPLFAVCATYGLRGGILFGPAALPLNVLMFYLAGHPEYAPENLSVAWVSGIITGIVLGYLSDFFSNLQMEIDQRKETEAELRKALDEKHVLLTEVHHRVKNNLNVIKSLIELQRKKTNNTEFSRLAGQLRGRIFAIYLVQEQLYMADNLAHISAQDYMHKLVENLLTSFYNSNNDLQLVMDIQDLTLDLETASPLGLIINEAVTNAMKYAFTDNNSPELSISFVQKESRMVLQVKDNGPGFNPENENGRLGLKIMNILAQQLKAELNITVENGTTVRVEIDNIQ